MKTDNRDFFTKKMAEAICLTGLALFTTGGCSHLEQKEREPVPAKVARRELGNSMTMKEILFAYGTDLVIKDSDGVIGTVEQRTLKLTPSFEYRDNNGQVVAYASQQMLSFGTHIDIYDSSGAKIGAFQDKVFRNLLSISRMFSIQDAQGNEIGTSDKISFFGTSIKIYDRDKKHAATISRPAFDLGLADWSIEITGGEIDPKMLVFIPSYKTYSDKQSKKK
jgi:uncharacterized protein YxjI